MEKKPMPFYKKLLIGLLILILLNLVGLCAVLFLALSGKPLARPSAASVDQRAFLSALMKIHSLPQKLKKAEPGQTESVELTEPEFNALLLSALGEGGAGGFLMDAAGAGAPAAKLKNVWLRLDKGDFQLACSKDIGFWTPFGRHLNAHVRAKVKIDPKEESVTIKSASLGRLPLPTGLIQRWLDAQRLSYERSEGHAEMRKVVAELSCENGVMRIQYHPYELRSLIESKLGSTVLNFLL